jgi:hypothetical protein
LVKDLDGLVSVGHNQHLLGFDIYPGGVVLVKRHKENAGSSALLVEFLSEL